jgi:hypothetical protein
MGSKDLVGTIEKVEPHETDPTSNGRPDPWDTVTDEFDGLGRRLKDTYQKVGDGRGPNEEEIREAFSTLARAWDQVAESVSMALQDPLVRQRLKTVASSLATAVGATISELGKELRAAADGPVGENTESQDLGP